MVLGPSLNRNTLELHRLQPQLVANEELLWLHRETEGAHWFYIAAPTGKDFHGTVMLKAQGKAERWDAVTERSF